MSAAKRNQTRTQSQTQSELQSQQQQQQQQQHQATQPSPTTGLRKFTLDCLLELLKVIINLYDLISLPVFYLRHGVRERRRENELTIRSRKFDPDDPQSAWRQVDIHPRQFIIDQRIDSYTTYDAMMKGAFESFGERACYGYRLVLEERWCKRPCTGKLIRQVKLTDYRWISSSHFERQIEAARRGFLLEGVRCGQRVMLFADTRPEWQIASQALLRIGAVVATMYSTLGVEGIVHSVNETAVTHVVTQRDKIERLLNLKQKLPTLSKVIYFELNLELPVELGGQPEWPPREKARLPKPPTKTAAGVDCVSFARLLQRGLASEPAGKGFPHPDLDDQRTVAELEAASAKELAARNKDTLAVIMYTSGSTGVPKGVLISHGNIMATIKAFSYVTKDFVHQPLENICTAYLPLAHIFEFCIESVMLFHGVRYGFASPHTLTDKSPGLAAGHRGDLGLLQPTVMIIVPLILDRIVLGVKQALSVEGYFKSQLVSYLIDYKSRWQARHYDTPLVDKFVCSKVAAALGGRARYVICGSAPLSSETQRFVRAALNLKLPQGFGTTETCAATSCQLFDDQSTGNVGLPVAGAQIKLEPWLEGNYTPADRPNPRGEIVVGGQMIAQGYFKLEEQTKEAFFVDQNGVRWYRTGDIGEILPNGNLKIIDRKKDLVKLQNGEYISLGKVESILKSNPFLDNFCVYANSQHNYVVAMGPANKVALTQMAWSLVKERDQQLELEHDHQRQNQQRLPGVKSHASNYRNSNSSNNNSFDYKNHNKHDHNDSRRRLIEDDQQLAHLREVLANSEDSKEPLVNGVANTEDDQLQQLCANSLLQQAVLDSLQKLGRERNLMSLEIPRKLMLIPEEWTEDTNLVTAAMKIRRNYIYRRYQTQLDALYES